MKDIYLHPENNTYPFNHHWKMNETELLIKLESESRGGYNYLTDTALSALIYLSNSLNTLAHSDAMPFKHQKDISHMNRVVKGLIGTKGQKIADNHTFLTASNDALTLNPRNEEFLQKLTSLINNHMTEDKLDIEFMTRHFNMSHSTFYRKVKEVTGYTAVDFIRRMKLQRGIELLRTRAYRISEVCYMTGFNSPAHFRQACKDEYHCTPSEILKEIKSPVSAQV
jgi:AraC-like DNA-binding protein